MKIKIPIKPLSVNAIFQGRRFKTPKYENYERSVAYLLPKIKESIKGYVKVHLTFYLKEERGSFERTDTTNLIKAIEDILVKAGFMEDDRKVVRCVVEKVPSDEFGIMVEIESTERPEKRKWREA